MIAVEVEGGKERKSCQSTSVKATCYASAGRRGDRSGGEGGARSSGPCRTGEEEGGGWGGKKGGGGRGGELLCMHAWKKGDRWQRKEERRRKEGKFPWQPMVGEENPPGKWLRKQGMILKENQGKKNMVRHTQYSFPSLHSLNEYFNLLASGTTINFTVN